jgi:predicted amino acid racemase
LAYIELNRTKLRENFNLLNNLFKNNNINWAIVTKVLCGNKDYVKEIIDLGVTQICDSRITNLKMLKQLNPKIETIYIKPPAKGQIANLIKYADITMNTELSTIKALSKEAVKQKRKHKIIIMIEMGELREGVMRDDLMRFYGKVFELPNIEVVGLGANFTCLYGVLPSEDKLIQLSLYEQLIEAKFNKLIPFVSGGSSVVIPLVMNNTLPKGINHFRVGETLFLGTNVYDDTHITEMHNDTFKLFAEIIELAEKPLLPNGKMGTNLEGKSFEFDDKEAGEKAYRAIIDLGLLDVDEKHITPIDARIRFAGASSDMIVIDLEDNPAGYKVGDKLEFGMDYMGLLRLMNSKYIEKRIKS